MRELTDRQRLALERISNSAAAEHVTVVGWADDGPVLKLKRGMLAVLRPDGQPAQIMEMLT